ncbi:unnamed protein product [Amoebophrya sp. A120]|nr:unnamed protein product [Amoebophrya sp. A120]|eukprot:GSA120T00005582001.1
MTAVVKHIPKEGIPGACAMTNTEKKTFSATEADACPGHQQRQQNAPTCEGLVHGARQSFPAKRTSRYFIMSDTYRSVLFCATTLLVGFVAWKKQAANGDKMSDGGGILSFWERDANGNENAFSFSSSNPVTFVATSIFSFLNTLTTFEELLVLTAVYTIYAILANSFWLCFFKTRRPNLWNILRSRPGFVCESHQAEIVMCFTLAPHHLIAGLLHIYGHYLCPDLHRADAGVLSAGQNFHCAQWIKHGILWEAAFNLQDYVACFAQLFPHNSRRKVMADHVAVAEQVPDQAQQMQPGDEMSEANLAEIQISNPNGMDRTASSTGGTRTPSRSSYHREQDPSSAASRTSLVTQHKVKNKTEPAQMKNGSSPKNFFPPLTRGRLALAGHHFGAGLFGLACVESDLLYREDLQKMCIALEFAAAIALFLLGYLYTLDFRRDLKPLWFFSIVNTTAFTYTRVYEFPKYAFSLATHLVQGAQNAHYSLPFALFGLASLVGFAVFNFHAVYGSTKRALKMQEVLFEELLLRLRTRQDELARSGTPTPAKMKTKWQRMQLSFLPSAEKFLVMNLELTRKTKRSMFPTAARRP